MIAVTGGAGFIGKVLIESLQKRTNEDILNVDFRVHSKVRTIHPYDFWRKWG